MREAALCVVVLLLFFVAYRLMGPTDADCRCFVFPALPATEGVVWLMVRNGLLTLCGLRLIASKPRI